MALEKRNILCQTKTIKISTNQNQNSRIARIQHYHHNGNLLPQKTLNIIDNYQTIFCLDIKKQTKKTTNNTIVRFFYVAADLQLLTNFLDQYAEIEGEPRYGTENIKKSNTKQEQLASKLHKLQNISHDVAPFSVEV